MTYQGAQQVYIIIQANDNIIYTAPRGSPDDTHSGGKNSNTLIGGGKNKIDRAHAHVLTSNKFVIGRIDRRRKNDIDPE